ncbi:MAG: hypothetical protein Q9162_004360 [Coniocarpon cinnabarinum]
MASEAPSHTADPVTPSTASLPRLLCIHGGGVTAEIFALQLRSFRAALSSTFRLVFADGPFFCNAGPGMLPVYAGMGPYRRWLRWIDAEHPEVGDDEALEEIEYKVRETMEEDDARGGKGEWVGLVGFSQGAKVSASILYDCQLRLEEQRRKSGKEDRNSKKTEPAKISADGLYGGFFGADEEQNDIEPMDLSDMPEGLAGGKWRFALLFAGRAPLVKMSSFSEGRPRMMGAGGISEGGFEFDVESNEDRLILPSVHVHGLQDPGRHLHQRLRDYYSEGDANELVEWDGGHRVPFKSADTEKVVDATLRAAKRAAVLPVE